MKIIVSILHLILLASCSTAVRQEKSAKISPDDIASLEFATQIQEKIGDQVWPEFSKYKTAVLFQTVNGQILLNLKKAPEYFKSYSGPSPYWGAPAYEAQELRAADGSILTKKEYDEGYFASAYSKEQTGLHYSDSVFVLDSIEQFHKKDNKWPLEDWISIFWHEVFHNFQDQQYQSGYVTKELTAFYKVRPLIDDKEYKKLVLAELKLVSKALKVSSQKEKRRMICHDLAILRKRRAKYIEQKRLNSLASEMFYETSEGTARYVEEMALLAAAKLPEIDMNEVATKIPARYLFSKFDKYKKRKLSDYFDRITVLHEGERYFYQTGFSLALALDQLGTNWKTKVFKTDGGLYALVETECKSKH